MRVTNQIQQSNALQNIFRITEDLFQANQRVASGKRINRPSDDPLGLNDTLTLRSSIAQIQQFGRNIDNNRLFLNTADSALDSVGLGITRALELAQAGLGPNSSAQTRAMMAVEVEAILDQAIQEANTQVKGHFIFGGSDIQNAPYQPNGSGLGAQYSGNAENLLAEVAPGITIPLTRPGPEVFGTDLNPAVSLNTPLADLNGGAGIPLGSFTITDRAGNPPANINVVGGMTVGGLLAAINGSGINVNATINASQDGIALTDTSPVVTQPMTVAEVGTGTTAQSLGILGQADGVITGGDLNPVLTAAPTATLISDLNGGAGLTLGQIEITNGTFNGIVDLSGAVDINDVINLINGSGLNVTASINAQGNALQVVSNSAATTAVVNEVGGGNTALALGIGGGNVFTALDTLRDALERNDTAAILASFDNLNASQDTVISARAEYGALVRTVDNLAAAHDADEVNQTGQMSQIEDSDFVKDASDVAALQLALEATLNTTARILQPSLMDFLR
ncbi:MAG: flagellar hook-associated protein 3 [Nitrospinaceae bacterium]|nr:flagellar hook-associated protein 3 [Nitrospinaceae bacterium]NIR53410.1 flagellar hook-associated protein 3 [Nitrospinaceae bacterium]NIT80610.1 flagellar hook-associated protein 3 [Nitrospinaceae bacterium]NIX33014.1 flagellar hook-associated protein 3 [Nitrospinaceae bacterium]NIY13634.1 flagellar hook-associated protein 3 [Nitrospinaceae bacterium]